MPPLDVRICFFGDSVTYGYGDAAGGFVPRLLAPELWPGCVVTGYNLGVRADTSREIRRRWLAEARVRLVEPYRRGLVFAFGTNDAALRNGRRRQTAARTRRHSAAIAVAIADPRTTLFVGPLPVDPKRAPLALSHRGMTNLFDNERMAEVDRILAEVAAGRGIGYVSLLATLLADPTWLGHAGAGDGLHPVGDGCRTVARAITGSAAWIAWHRSLTAPDQNRMSEERLLAT